LSTAHALRTARAIATKDIQVALRDRLPTILGLVVPINFLLLFILFALSGGQAQCAAIARALVNEPKLIIADEPTGNLDSAASRLVMELLSEVHKTGNTVLFVTHNPELTRYATRVVYMHDGAIVHDEKKALGQVADTARKALYSVPMTTEEDDLAGVSALMKALPSKPAARSKRKPKARKAPAKHRATRGKSR